MPIYEFACEKCHSEFELLMRGNEQAQCPECGSTEIEKQFSVPAAHSGTGDLPISGTCGRPQCGMGGCQGMM
jgi:putative FmdB family regulatory protein